MPLRRCSPRDPAPAPILRSPTACRPRPAARPTLVRELIRALREQELSPSPPRSAASKTSGRAPIARTSSPGRAGSLRERSGWRARSPSSAPTPTTRRTARLAEMDDDAAREALDRLAGAGLIALGERPIEFAHPILRSAVYAASPPWNAVGCTPAQRSCSPRSGSPRSGSRPTCSQPIRWVTSARLRSSCGPAVRRSPAAPPAPRSSYLRRALAEPPTQTSRVPPSWVSSAWPRSTPDGCRRPRTTSPMPYRHAAASSERIPIARDLVAALSMRAATTKPRR